MNRWIPMIVFFIVCCMSCSTQKIDEKKFVRLLQNYREIKSIEYALHGDVDLNPEIAKFWHKDFFGWKNNFHPDIYVLKNEFEFDHVEVDTDDYVVSKYGKNVVFDIKGKEVIIGRIIDNKIERFQKARKPNGGYVFIIEKGVPLLYMDGMLRAYYVLEKDVPVLLDRLKKTGAKY